MMLWCSELWCEIEMNAINTYHSENKPRLLSTLSLHHLEDIHHTLTLTAINGGSYGTKHS